MTYDAVERSEQDAAPIELYLFTQGACDAWRYTSAESDISYADETWTSTPIARNKIEATPEKARNNLELLVPRNNAVAELFRVQPPSDVIAVTLYRFHRDEGSYVVEWIGRVLNCTWHNTSQAKLHCEPVSTSLKRNGLRRLYQAQCPHVLYGPACGVDRSLHAEVGEVAAIDGSTITVSGLSEKPWAGGFVDLDNGEGSPIGSPAIECTVERRFIVSAESQGSPAGAVLQVLFPFSSALEVGAMVTVSPGCDHTMATCDGVYDNTDNYGGFPFIPEKNPFGGTQVY